MVQAIKFCMLGCLRSCEIIESARGALLARVLPRLLSSCTDAWMGCAGLR
jgi:hypothetical protein